ncbi:hypothetical protein D1007_41606 [Hordeum vulgare]|nr:hypothetical protein D1007_41606 [Hordeum vulgare]
MANFTCNPVAFLPSGFSIEQGPADCKVRADMALSATPPLCNDDFAIAESNRPIPIHLRYVARQEVARLLNHDMYFVRDVQDTALGLGLFRFNNVLIRDAVVGETYLLGEDNEFTFVKHDEGLNMHMPSLGSECWIMLLAFPQDYQTNFWVDKAISQFGKLILWFAPRESASCILVKTWVMSPSLVPSSLVLRQMGGQRRSWTVPIYILGTTGGNIHVHQVPLAREDPPPRDGNQPHPLHGPHTTAQQAFQTRLQILLQQNGVFGPANGANQDEEEPVTPDRQHAPLLFFPPAGLLNYQAILTQQGVSFFDGISPPHNIIDSPLSAWNDNVIDDISDSSEDSGQIISLPSSITMSITLTGPTRSQAAAEIFVDNATVPDLYYFARSVILNLQVPTITRGPFGIQTLQFSSISLHGTHSMKKLIISGTQLLRLEKWPENYGLRILLLHRIGLR